jgi:type IV pilus assembly protein PilQ
MKYIIYFIFLVNLIWTQSLMEDRLDQRVGSLQFRNTSIKDVLTVLAKQNALNMVISTEVEGNISMSLVNVTVREVLSAVCASEGLHYIIDNDVILIKPFEKAAFNEVKSRVFKTYYIDAVQLLKIIESMLSIKGKAEIFDLEKTEKIELRRSDLLVVSDVEDNLERIASIIQQLDIPLPQFLIEVKLVEIILDENDQVGFDWPTSIGASITGANPTTSAQTLTNGDKTSNAYIDLTYPYMGYMQMPPQKDGFKWGILTVDQLRFALDFLAQDKNSKIISSPKVTTLNNKKAVISAGTTLPIPEVSRGVGGDLITYKYKPIDVKVEVIPIISPDNKISLSVHPTIEEVVGYVGEKDYPQPIVSVREVQTTVSVSSDQTLVIGGLLKETKTSTVKKIWLLGDIPLIGKLFQNVVSNKVKTDLLIFITPKIMVSN